MRRIRAQKQKETSAAKSVTARQPWPPPRSAPQHDSEGGAKYRLAWRRGSRRPRHDRTWGHLRRDASIVHETPTRDGRVTADACGVATLVVEVRGERTYLWRNWQAGNYPFVCALLEELGKPNPFRSLEVTPALHESTESSHTAEPATRRARSVRT